MKVMRKKPMRSVVKENRTKRMVHITNNTKDPTARGARDIMSTKTMIMTRKKNLTKILTKTTRLQRVAIKMRDPPRTAQPLRTKEVQLHMEAIAVAVDGDVVEPELT